MTGTVCSFPPVTMDKNSRMGLSTISYGSIRITFQEWTMWYSPITLSSSQCFQVEIMKNVSVGPLYLFHPLLFTV